MTVAVIASGYDADNASIVVGSSNIIQLNLNNANVWTAQQTFTIGHLALKGASTGVVVLSTAISGSISYTITFPAQTSNDTVALIGTPSTWTAAQTFTNSDLILLGSSTGYTTFTSANSSASNYTITVPAITDTLVTLTATQILTNKTLTSPAVGSGLFNNTAQTTLSGTTAGSVVWSQPEQGSAYKKFVAYFNGYENNSASNQTITYTTAFTNIPAIVVNTVTGGNLQLTLGSTTSTLTIVSPNSTTTYTGWVIIEGY